VPQHHLPLLFGLYTDASQNIFDALKHISEVRKGKKCQCRCPACGAKLIAKKGRRKKHHFAHYFVSECAAGAETALHSFAKMLLLEKRLIKLPPIFAHGNKEALIGTRTFHANYAQQEVSIGSLKADVVLANDMAELVVEIKVSHQVDAF